MKLDWAKPADIDLDEIWSYIALDNIDAADRTAERIRQAATILADYPSIGRRGRLDGTRELVVSGLPYIIVYQISETRVEVLRVHHGARDWPPRTPA